jgi:RNA polymerase sigma factor (sigma-70 family)
VRRDTLAEIEAVYRQRFPVFLRVAVAIVGDEQLARDAVQDGFVRAVRYRRRLRGEPEAWVWRIVVNEARRRRAREGRLVHVDPAELPEPSTNGHSEPGDVRSLVAALPDRQRLVLFLRYYADLDYEAISAALEVAPGTVAATLNAAHSKLRAQMRATSVGF